MPPAWWYANTALTPPAEAVHGARQQGWGTGAAGDGKGRTLKHPPDWHLVHQPKTARRTREQQCLITQECKRPGGSRRGGAGGAGGHRPRSTVDRRRLAGAERATHNNYKHRGRVQALTQRRTPGPTGRGRGAGRSSWRIAWGGGQDVNRRRQGRKGAERIAKCAYVGPRRVRCAHLACAASPLTPARRLFTAPNPPPKHEHTANSSAEQGCGEIGRCSQAADADAVAATFPAAR